MMSEVVKPFWQAFCATRDDVTEEPYDIFKIGNNAKSADEGSVLILDGIKTATSALPQEFADMPLPYPGAFSVVLNGKDQPCAIVETTNVETKPFAQADESFARDYGEWERTLESWLDHNGRNYQAICKKINIEWNDQTPLIFERFEVVYPITNRSERPTGGA